MTLEKRINAFVELGNLFCETGKNVHASELSNAVDKAAKHNGWFTEENIAQAIGSLGEMLEENKLRDWISNYPTLLNKNTEPKKTGVIMAGNIPLVGFHDFICVLMSGNDFVGKLSSDDEVLLPAVSKLLVEIEPQFENKIFFTTKTFQKKTEIAAFIATGSNNSARYFEYYFGKYPHIIRKNRNAVAVLDGTENESDLKNLGKDIFQYFGLGCRNVSKIFIPEDYILDRFFEAIVDFGDVIHHNKYANNYSYYRTIYLLNSEKFLDNNFLLLKESPQIASPVATLFYERYKNQKELYLKLESEKDNIQCIVGSPEAPLPKERGTGRVKFGRTQTPGLFDYADGIDTMKFLLSL